MGTLYLMHHGIKGQKWGVRRFQNPDGTLTALGKERYYTSDYNKRFYNNVRKNNSVGSEYMTELKEAAQFVNKQADIINQQKSQLENLEMNMLKELGKNQGKILRISKFLEDESYEKGVYIDDFYDIISASHPGNFLKECKDYKKYEEMLDTMRESKKTLNENIQSMVDDFVGEYGDKPALKTNTIIDYNFWGAPKYYEASLSTAVSSVLNTDKAAEATKWGNDSNELWAERQKVVDKVVDKLKKDGYYVYD